MRTVNFIEAVNSRKRFRCIDKSSNDFNDDFCVFDTIIGFLEKLNEYGAIPVDLFFNSQFELEEKSITITESKFDDAFDLYYVQDREAIKKELGF